MNEITRDEVQKWLEKYRPRKRRTIYLKELLSLQEVSSLSELKGIEYTHDRVQSSPKAHDDAWVDAIDRLDKIRKEIYRLEKENERVEKALQFIPPRERLLLTYKYIEDGGMSDRGTPYYTAYRSTVDGRTLNAWVEKIKQKLAIPATKQVYQSCDYAVSKLQQVLDDKSIRAQDALKAYSRNRRRANYLRETVEIILSLGTENNLYQQYKKELAGLTKWLKAIEANVSHLSARGVEFIKYVYLNLSFEDDTSLSARLAMLAEKWGLRPDYMHTLNRRYLLEFAIVVSDNMDFEWDVEPETPDKVKQKAKP